jgi:hypothetical protein
VIPYNPNVAMIRIRMKRRWVVLGDNCPAVISAACTFLVLLIKLCPSEMKLQK